MTFRGLAVFSLAAVFGSFESCQPSASMRLDSKPVPPPLSLPLPPPEQPSAVPTRLPVPEPIEPDNNVSQNWKPSAPAKDWTSIVIHHTATDRGSVESIHEAHLQREWLGIGYHFVIGNGNGMPDGEIEATFRWREQLHGAHAGSNEYNQHGIGIALIGNFDETPPTTAQLDAVKRLVAELKTHYEITGEKVIGHSEVKATACPGKFFPLDDVRRAEKLAQAEALHRPTITLARQSKRDRSPDHAGSSLP